MIAKLKKNYQHQDKSDQIKFKNKKVPKYVAQIFYKDPLKDDPSQINQIKTFDRPSAPAVANRFFDG